MARRLVLKGSLNGTDQILREFPVGDSQNIKRGDIVVLTSNKAVIAADAAAAGTVLGVSDTDIVTTTATAADVIKVDINPASIYRAAYIGAATPAIGNKYDMGGAAYQFDADDTTGGWIQVVGNVDTAAKEADIILTNRVFGIA
ncbi:hypothetical protein [Paenibacillus contaminans]|uniref:DUF2190 domain-containing protein n=1 Tax=Paenibacillus contaminans TaxID=450362 RepID=A0A329MSE7_9BACL|nr:hypothetical protein [Paenibacillus contaminans]RAV22208.1 hypothetical protein DQG23_04450 [Paenibacillus contaminans]